MKRSLICKLFVIGILCASFFSRRRREAVLHSKIRQGIGQFFFERGVAVFKFLDASLKLCHLMIGKIHGEFKRINPIAKILTLRSDAFRVLPERCRFYERGNMGFLSGLCSHFAVVRPTHATFPMVNRFIPI